MLIRFTVSNFLSFKEPTTFDMVASSERIHPHHVVRTKSRLDPNLLRMGVVYGANAAGKSNLVKALRFVQDLVIKERGLGGRIPVQRFRLDPDCAFFPATFATEFRVNNTNYAYSLVVDQQRIQSETLRTTTSTSEVLLFERRTSGNNQADVRLGSFTDELSTREVEILEFIADGTGPNRLFLAETVERNRDYFLPAYNWFKNALVVVDPSNLDVSSGIPLASSTVFTTFLPEMLTAAGTGVTNIETKKASSAMRSLLSEEWLEELQGQLAEGESRLVRVLDERFVLAKRGDEIRVLRLVALHGDVPFEIHEESDGTQRLIDLVPLLYGLTAGTAEQVIVVDEIGRSLHPHLTQLIVDMHLDKAHADKQTQLLITTHETFLLDLDILRRDEIWFAEKKEDGATDLYSLSDFQPRYDKDVRRDYLVGRYGAIPFIGSVAQLQLTAMEEQEAEPTDAF